jgi:hypothetical protein
VNPRFQIHLTPDYKSGNSSSTEGKAPASFDEYDGCALIEVPTLEHLQKALADEYYVNTIAVDEGKFIDKEDGFLSGVGEVNRVL